MKFIKNKLYYFLNLEDLKVISIVRFDHKEKENSFFVVYLGINSIHEFIENNEMYIPDNAIFPLETKILSSDMKELIIKLFSKYHPGIK